MQRVLDIDLDFFVQPVVYCTSADAPRPNPATHTVGLDDDTVQALGVLDRTPHDAAIGYLRERVALKHPLPGAAFEHHHEAFAAWEMMITDGVLHAPFHVTHLDAHADFAEGQTTHPNIVCDVVHLPVEERPARSRALLDDGDFLAHAVACRWIGAIDYVYCAGGGTDIRSWYWEGSTLPPWNDLKFTATIRLAPPHDPSYKRLSGGLPGPPISSTEPRVPFTGCRQHLYTAPDPFDFVFLARSPAF